MVTHEVKRSASNRNIQKTLIPLDLHTLASLARNMGNHTPLLVGKGNVKMKYKNYG